MKKVRTPDYNYNFDPKTGAFARWGKTLTDDPKWSPLGPEIMDIEISTICHGLGAPCKFCYKSNGFTGKNMSLETFIKMFDKFTPNLTQIAFGIGDIEGNPDMFPIFEYSKNHGVIPNVTINGWQLNDVNAKRLSELCGAVAVSRYNPKDVCYDAVKKLTDLGMTQVNIHMLVSEETFKDCQEVLEDAISDPRLAKLNAIVFLAAKQKGRGTYLTSLSLKKYKELVNDAFAKKVRIGFDSCSANKFLKAIKGLPNEKLLATFTEPCESGLFSYYINVDGVAFPCSFMEGQEDIKGIDLLKIDDFLKDVWLNKEIEKWRTKLQISCRSCPIYKI